MFSSNSCLSVCEVSLQASSSVWDIVKSRRVRGTQAGRERRACNDHSFIFLSYLCGTLCQPKPTISWTKSVALSYPQNAHPDYLIPLWPLPWHRPGQCCPVEVRNVPARLQHCFRGRGGAICSYQCFPELYLETRHSNVHFSQNNIVVKDCSLKL